MGKNKDEKLNGRALLDVLGQHGLDLCGAMPERMDAKLWSELARRTGRDEESGYKDESYDQPKQ